MSTDARRLPVAVVTGGHSFDVVSFHRLFWGFEEEMDCYIQHVNHFASSPREQRDFYRALLFYFEPMDGPTDDGPWYTGQPRSALEHAVSGGQGVVVLHHSLGAYPDWGVWHGVTGIDERDIDVTPEQRLRVEVEDHDHPITEGLEGWEATEEAYMLPEPGPGSRTLLTIDHPGHMHSAGWTRSYGDSRVFCLTSGHDNQVWSRPEFREVLRRGILWSARRL